MPVNQSISHTARPDGTIVHYPFGMQKPITKCFGEIMKKAALKKITAPSCKVLKLECAKAAKEIDNLLDQAQELLTANYKRR